ncbi:MAG: hypothetical protein ACR2O0_09485 [Rhizobiaceae bacterium]
MRDKLSFSANQVARKLGAGATIWVNPDKIVWDVANIRSRRPKNVGVLLDYFGLITKTSKNRNMFYRNRFIISDEDFVIREKFADSDKFRIVSDYVANSDDYKKSIWYGNLLSDFSDNGTARYKNMIFASKGEVESFFENYLAPIRDSMGSSGYDPNIAGDLCKCYLSRNGELMKGENGRHRLAFAKALGIERFPLTIFGAHEDWFSENIGDEMDFSKLRGAIRNLESQNR